MSKHTDHPIRGLEGIAKFLRKNEDLILKVQESFSAGTEAVGNLATRLENNRIESAALLNDIRQLKFSISSDEDTRLIQKLLLKEIRSVSKRMQTLSRFPALTSNLLLQRSALYLQLGNTYNELVERFVPLTEQEAVQLRELLRRATLDAESRERVSAILDGAINISKFALRVALKLT